MRTAVLILLGALALGACKPTAAAWPGRKPGLWRLTTHSEATSDSVIDQCVAPREKGVTDAPVEFPEGCTGPLNFDIKKQIWRFTIICPIGPGQVARFKGQVTGDFQASYLIDMTLSNGADAKDKGIRQTTQAQWVSAACPAEKE